MAFCGEDHLQEFVGVIKKIFEFVALRSENFCSELRCNFYAGNRRIFCDIADFVDLDAGFTGKCGFQLFGKRSGFCISSWKGADKSRKMRLHQIRRKVDARNSGSGQKLCETAFRSSSTKRYAIEQNLLA